MLIIRSAEEKDLPIVAQLVKQPHLGMSNGNYPGADWFTRYIDQNYFLVAEDQGQVVGFISGEPLKGSGIIVHYFAVDPKKQGQGIGTTLLNEYETLNKQSGIKWILLYTPIKSKAVEFYKKRGFSENEADIEMVKRL